MDHTRDRVMGSLLGLAVGDALGTSIEFSPRDSYEHLTDIVGGGPFQLNAGEWTDDTGMALCLADSLLHTKTLDCRDLLERFVGWMRQGDHSPKGYCFDIGSTTRKAILAWEQQGTVHNCVSDRDSGNGGIMRLAPCVIAAWKNSAQASEWAAQSSAVTHGSDLCLHSAEFLAKYLCNLYQGVTATPWHSEWREEIKNIANCDYTLVSRSDISSSGYVIHTLEAAVWAVQNSDCFRDAVLLAVNLGDDSDTVGAVTGQIAGARWGMSDIPQKWINCLYERDSIVKKAEELYELGKNHIS